MLTLDASGWVAAFDPHDHFHEGSISFLRAVARQRLRLHAPAFLLVEVGCALAQRARDTATGQAALERLRAHPALVLHAMHARLIASAIDLGLSQQLRGADALYAATAAISKAPLISWDSELVDRAGAVTPERWMAEDGRRRR